MRKILLVLLLTSCLATSAAAQRRRPQTVEVRLSNFDFEPSTIHLRAGQPVILHLVNASSGGHNFAAPQFFAAARVRSRAGVVRRGAIEVPRGSSVDVILVPARGDYQLRCTHLLHTTFGMEGRIIVD